MDLDLEEDKGLVLLKWWDNNMKNKRGIAKNEGEGLFRWLGL